MQKIRQVVLYKHYFRAFFEAQSSKVQEKTLWTLRLLEEHSLIPANYLKYIEGTSGIYEIRIH